MIGKLVFSGLDRRIDDNNYVLGKEIRAMKKTVIGMCMLFCVSIMPATSFAGVDFILDIKPGSLLISPDVDGFKVENSSYYYSHSETIEGSGSWMPTIKLGIGFDTPPLYIDFTGGFGHLWNSAFNANMFLGDVAVRFKLNRVVTLGPHISVVRFDPTWEGDSYTDSDDVKLSGCTGFMPGLCLTIGGKIISFSFSLDYLDASFDVKTYNGWRANEDAIDISGFSLNLGALLRF